MCFFVRLFWTEMMFIHQAGRSGDAEIECAEEHQKEDQYQIGRSETINLD